MLSRVGFLDFGGHLKILDSLNNQQIGMIAHDSFQNTIKYIFVELKIFYFLRSNLEKSSCKIDN